MAATTATLLTVETVPAYLDARASEIGVFPPGAALVCSAIVGGNVNFAFHVKEPSTGKALFVKQAPEYVAVFGPDGLPLTSARMQQEIDVFARWRAILGPERARQFLPDIYLFDTTNMVFVMEFLGDCELLDHSMVATGEVPLEVASGLGAFMGVTHAATHESKVDPTEAATLKTAFENRPMRDVQLEYVFSKCYREAEAAAELRDDAAFMAEIASLKAAYDGKDPKSPCVLSHGDLHPGSVMASTSAVKVIDPEFTVYGPCGLDVGSLLSGFLLAALHHAYFPTTTEEDKAKARAAAVSLRNSAAAVWDAYATAMREGGVSEADITAAGAESVGFAVAEACRTALGFAGGRKWLQFEDAKAKGAAEAATLALVRRCMVARHTGGMALLLSELDALASGMV